MKYNQQSLNGLVNQIENGYSKLQEVITEIPSSCGRTPIIGYYNLRDIIIHIACWEQFCIDSLKEIKRNTIKTGKPNIKKINFGFYEANKNKSLRETKDVASKNHRKLLGYLRKLDYKILSNPEPFYPDKNDIYTMITHCTTRHYPWAIMGIRKYLRNLKCL